MWPVEMLPPPYTAALLEVLQAKSTAGHDPEVLKELRTAPDLAPQGYGTSLPYRGYVGGPAGPACSVPGAAQPSCWLLWTI